MRDTLASIGWVDGLLLAVLALSVIIGLVRGVVFELMSLAGWVVAWFASQWFARDVAPHLPVGAPGSAANHLAAVVLCFVAALLAWSLLAKLVRMLVQATPLSLPDRFLGAGFGLLRGAVLLLALSTVVSLTPAAQSQAWSSSQGATWLSLIMQGLRPLLPEQALRLLPAS